MARCNRCRMHLERCICGHMPNFDLATRLVLVMHRHEVSKTTATGPLALAVLANSELRVHGYQERPLDLADLQQPERRLLILYPGEDAPLLSRSLLEEDLRPVTLVVPDGNWRQASRMGRRLPGVEQAEMVRLPAAAATEWGVRREPHPEGLATFEAIARAMGILESAEVQQRMERLFRLMVQETLQARGGRKELL
jgi:DTW domain-containing protein YfiP